MSDGNATTILVIGTFDTKSDELGFLRSTIERQGGQVIAMDVSVLGETVQPVTISRHDVATAAGSTVAEAAASGDENEAMQIMARGASMLTRRLHDQQRIHGMIALRGTMGTDLALG